jgi:hypothetical protein
MKQARTGLLVAMALLLVPTMAGAQGGAKPAGDKEKPGAAAKPGDKKPEAGKAGADSETEFDADAPEEGAEGEGTPGAEPEPGEEAGGGSLEDIC